MKSMTAHICMNSGNVVPVSIKLLGFSIWGICAYIQHTMSLLDSGVPVQFDTGFTVSARDYQWIMFDTRGFE